VLHHHLALTAARVPERTAVIAGERRLTYRELDETSTRVARGLMALGVARGERVVIQLDNGVETVIAIYGVLKAGAAIVMVNPSTKAQKLSYILSNARARALIVGGVAREALADLVLPPDVRATVVVGAHADQPVDPATVPWAAIADTPSAEPLGDRGIDLDLAALLYTSGSTGDPKGVMLTHRNITSATASIAAYLNLTQDDVIFNVLPLSFGYGLTQLFPTVMVGGCLVIEKGILYPHVTLKQMAAHRATGFAVVPTIATTLLNIDLSKYDLSHLRYVTNAGAGMPTEVVRGMRRALPHVQLYLMYGQTECLRALYLDPAQTDQRPDSVGRGMPNQELMIVDESGAEVGPNVVGELVVRGSHVMTGYWERPEETERKLRQGKLEGERVLYTGDLFRRDEDGYYYFVARQDDIIKSRGEKVSPREVENVIHALPEVLEVVVAGVPDARLGQAVTAYVVLKPGAVLEARDIKRHCAASLEDYMVPSAVEFRTELPKNERGKVAKRELVATSLGLN
jgi:amino acid adenylation domain-containing protein